MGNFEKITTEILERLNTLSFNLIAVAEGMSHLHEMQEAYARGESQIGASEKKIQIYLLKCYEESLKIMPLFLELSKTQSPLFNPKGKILKIPNMYYINLLDIKNSLVGKSSNSIYMLIYGIISAWKEYFSKVPLEYKAEVKLDSFIKNLAMIFDLIKNYGFAFAESYQNFVKEHAIEKERIIDVSRNQAERLLIEENVLEDIRSLTFF